MSLTRVRWWRERARAGAGVPGACRGRVRFSLHARGRVLAHTTGVVARCEARARSERGGCGVIRGGRRPRKKQQR